MNVVFDLGGVVFRWQPELLVRNVFADPKSRNLAMARIIKHKDWVELDRGSIALDDAIDRAAARTALPRKNVERLFNAVPRSLTPIEETIELIRAVKKAGSGLYVLSNMHHASIAHLEQNHDIWGLFDGAVISCRVNMVKPEPEIYEHLLDNYRLNPIETVFIDDMAENTDAASAVGLHTIRFVDPAQCRAGLSDLIGL